MKSQYQCVPKIDSSCVRPQCCKIRNVSLQQHFVDVQAQEVEGSGCLIVLAGVTAYQAQHKIHRRFSRQ